MISVFNFFFASNFEAISSEFLEEFEDLELRLPLSSLSSFPFGFSIFF